jgi:hypothetical protein
MKQVDRWKSVLFVGSLAAIAVFIGARHQSGSLLSAPQEYTPPQSVNVQVEKPNTQEGNSKAVEDKLALAKLAAEEKAAEHSKFLARNINPGVARGATPTVAVIAATTDGKLAPQLTTSVIRRLATNGVEFVSSYFTPEFVSDGNFKRLADGASELISNLELAKTLDGLVLASESIDYSTDPSLADLMTAALHLEVSLTLLSNHNERQTFVWNSAGSGFRQTDARQMAEERIMKQIARDTNFFLPPINRTL